MQREEACLEGQGPEPSLEKKPLPSLPMTRAQCSHQRERTPTTHPRLVITTSPPPWGPRATPILHMRRDLRLHFRKWRKAVRCQPEGRAAPPMGTPSSVKSHPQRTAVRGGLRVTSPLVPQQTHWTPALELCLVLAPKTSNEKREATLLARN